MNYDTHRQPDMTSRVVGQEPDMSTVGMRFGLGTLALSLHLSANYHRVHAQRTATGVVAPPYFATNIWRIDQMVYYPYNRTLYLPMMESNVVAAIYDMTSVPLTPTTAAPWAYSIVAGIPGSVGLSLTEVPPSVALFRPTGITGWPLYTVSSATAAPPTEGEWAGLWICDNGSNNAIRFVNFLRGNNVTTVAGNGFEGAQNGLGVAARVTEPAFAAMGRFLLADAHAGGSPPPSAWTSVVYWTLNRFNCVQQGVPTQLATSLPSSLSTTVPPLENMALDVTEFVGGCSDGAGGALTGLAHRRQVLRNPWGIAVVNPFPIAQTYNQRTTNVMLIGEYGNNRLSMVLPMYPSTARYLTVVLNNGAAHVTGITSARTQLREDATTVYSVMEVMFGTDNGGVFKDLAMPFTLSKATGVMTLTDASLSFSVTTEQRSIAYQPVMIPHAATNSTLIVLSSGGMGGGVAMRFYCCLGPEYSVVAATPDATAPPGAATPCTAVTTTDPASTSTLSASAVATTALTSDVWLASAIGFIVGLLVSCSACLIRCLICRDRETTTNTSIASSVSSLPPIQRSGDESSPILMRPRDTPDADDLCRLCFDLPRTTTFQPCGHHVVCEACAMQLRQRGLPCPICRAVIVDSIASVGPAHADTMGRPRPAASAEPPAILVERIPATELQTLSAFDRRALIRQGAFGVVYRGTYRGQPVAIKTFPPDGAAVDRGAFFAEVAALGTLKHPNLIAPLAYCDDAGDEAIVFPLYEPLDEAFLQALPLADIDLIVAHVASALAYLHSQRRVHRDVKPQNILVERRDGMVVRAVLCDVGILRSIDGTHHSTAAIGTPYFIDPESQRTQQCEFTNDVYALGVTTACLFARVMFPVGTMSIESFVRDRVPSRYVALILAMVGTVCRRPTVALVAACFGGPDIFALLCAQDSKLL